MSKAPESQRVMVTGASAGVGRAICRAFARQGAHLGLIARGRERLAATRSEVERLGGQALELPCDVADPDQIKDAAYRFREKFGEVDVWVNNAMASVFSPVVQTTPEEYKRVTEVTYLGCVYGTLAALEQMRPKNSGVIIQVGSALAYRSIPLQSAYCAAKHAILGFTESLRVELLHEKSRVSVCMVQLPAVNTPQFSWVKSRLSRKAQPVPPIYQPEVIADAVVWLSSHPRREIYVGFSTWKAILADKILPSLADRYLARSGYESQQTNEPEDPSRPHNLWNPAPGLQAAHGDFDDQARPFSLQFWLTRRKRLLLGAGAVAGAVVMSRKFLVQRKEAA